jgi:sigma-B regulation protein RsbU (phosphoserine phosphatase)
MNSPSATVRAQLLDRREQLAALVDQGRGGPQLEALLRDVDEAVEKYTAGTYGLCEACQEPIEPDRLEADPLLRLCLDHLTSTEARALEQDLILAAKVQQKLLPPSPMVALGWEIAYSYQPLGAVSGDYCDVVKPEGLDADLLLLVGDISGKGVAASMLMAHLHASMRTLVGFDLSLVQLIERANRLFCDSTMASHYATLVGVRLGARGAVEICNAGHCPPLLLRAGGVTPIPATGVPIGLFCVKDYAVESLTLEAGETLVLYTDGVTETLNEADRLYGEERMVGLVRGLADEPPQTIVRASVADVTGFRGSASRLDDVSVMAVRRTGQARPF